MLLLANEPRTAGIMGESNFWGQVFDYRERGRPLDQSDAPSEFISLQMINGSVAIQRGDAALSEVSLDSESNAIAPFPETAILVVENARACFGKLLASNQTGSASPIWKILNENRVVDIGLARRAVQLAGGTSKDKSLNCNTLAAQGAHLWERMHKAVGKSEPLDDKVRQFGPLGHGLRVRGMAALAAHADRGVCLGPDAREDLIAKCQRRIAILTTSLKKADPQLCGFLGRNKGNLDALLNEDGFISEWLKTQVKLLRDAHQAPIFPFLELMNEELGNDSAAWPLWALGVPHVSTLTALVATLRLCSDLKGCEDAILRPRLEVLPRFRVATCNLDSIPGLSAGQYLSVSPGCVPARLSFHPLTAAAVGAACRLDERLEGGLETVNDPLQEAEASLCRLLPEALGCRERSDWVEALIRYVASGGNNDVIKEFSETAAGITTNLSQGEYRTIRRQLCEEVLPCIGDWLADRMAEQVERSMPNPPQSGTLRRLASEKNVVADAALITEVFADPKARWGQGFGFPLLQMIREHPEWELDSERFVRMKPVENYQDRCTERIVSNAGMVRPHLPWCAARAESWRMAFDEAALNVVVKLTMAGHRLSWVSDKGVWLEVPLVAADKTFREINQVATVAAREIIPDVPTHLTVTFQE